VQPTIGNGLLILIHTPILLHLMPYSFPPFRQARRTHTPTPEKKNDDEDG